MCRNGDLAHESEAAAVFAVQAVFLAGRELRQEQSPCPTKCWSPSELSPIPYDRSPPHGKYEKDNFNLQKS